MSRGYQGSNKPIYWIVGIPAAVVLLLVVSWVLRNSSPKTNRELVASCTTDMATQFHIHPHLQIVINGQNQEIPANIGITPTCMHAIHTHDNSGTIHVEAPEKRDFTLADFFFVWGQPFTKDQLLGYKTDNAHRIRETVNGNEVQGYGETVLRDRDEIVIYYETKKP